MPVTGPGALRERHRQKVVDVLRRRGSASRAEIADDTSLSRATISSLVLELQERGVVIEREDDEPRGGSSGGRPPMRLALNPPVGSVLGVDFGHTHLRVAIADFSSRVLGERAQELDVDRSATEALDAAAQIAEELIEEAGIDRGRVLGAGMGLPGPIDRETGVVGSSVILSGWSGLRPAHELEQRLGIPVHVDNDANLGALGELSYGAGAGARHLVYVKVASGIGTGLVLDGRLFRGATGVAGEIGHVLVNPQGAVCRCGNRGCLETIAAAGPLLELLRPTYGPSFSVHDLARLAGEGDVGCRRVLADAGRTIGRALAGICNVLNPERVVIGGELSGAGESLISAVGESLARFALPAVDDAIDLRAGVLGDRAEVLGALVLVIADTELLKSERLTTQPR